MAEGHHGGVDSPSRPTPFRGRDLRSGEACLAPTGLDCRLIFSVGISCCNKGRKPRKPREARAKDFHPRTTAWRGKTCPRPAGAGRARGGLPPRRTLQPAQADFVWLLPPSFALPPPARRTDPRSRTLARTP